MKSKIHHLVDELQDETILKEVSRILSGESDYDILDDLMDEQLAGLEKAREKIRQGKGIPLEVMREKHRKRFPTANI